MNKPLLSIVVPTKDRYIYLKHLIGLIKSYESEEIELVIQDNTQSNEDIVEFIKGINYPHLKYFHEADQLPISLNSDKAILNSTGEYVCFIGDDDGVTKDITNLVYIMKSENTEAAITSPVSYRWPDAYALKGGELHFTKYDKRIIKKKSEEVLSHFMKLGFTTRDGLPCVYHGVVKRSTLNRIYNKCGTFFPGPSPDIANGVAVCLVINDFIIYDKPVIVPGVGAKHGGGKARENIELRNLPWLPKDIIEKWEPQIPKVWTATTIWCESSVKALRYMKREDLLTHVNFEYMYAVFCTLYVSSTKLVFEITQSKLRLFYYIIVRIINSIRKKIINTFFNRTIIVTNIQNISEAVAILSKK